MRALALFLCAAALSACGGGPAVTTTVSTAPRSTASADALLAAAGRPNAPGPDALVAALGAPDVDRREGAGAMLAWRLPECALALGFAADGQGRLRLSVVQADAPRPGAPVPSVGQCVAQARARGGSGS